MASRTAEEQLKLKYKPGLNDIYDGDKHYRFYQKDYYKSFINYFDKSYNRTYSKIAELCISNEDGRDYSRTINRYHEILLGGKSINTNSMGRKLVTMLLVLQEKAEFNPNHHTFIDEIETHKIGKFSYKWDDRAAKWQDITEYDNDKKNKMIAGYIYELIDIMTESDFYNLKVLEQTDAENGYYDNRINEIYSMIDELYMDNSFMNEKWVQIMNPIKDMIHRYEFPGVHDAIWIKWNEAITYFDVAYDIAEDNPEMFARINEGIAGIKFSIDLNQGMIERRKKYMQDKKEEDTRGNAYRSELQLLEEEMKIALKRILTNEFQAL